MSEILSWFNQHSREANLFGWSRSAPTFWNNKICLQSAPCAHVIAREVWSTAYVGSNICSASIWDLWRKTDFTWTIESPYWMHEEWKRQQKNAKNCFLFSMNIDCELHNMKCCCRFGNEKSFNLEFENKLFHVITRVFSV